MAHHQLGHKEQARAYLSRLRETMKQPQFAYQEQKGEAEGFLREAEKLLNEKPENANK